MCVDSLCSLLFAIEKIKQLSEFAHFLFYKKFRTWWNVALPGSVSIFVFRICILMFTSFRIIFKIYVVLFTVQVYRGAVQVENADGGDYARLR